MNNAARHAGLVELLSRLQRTGYAFVTVTPATHKRHLANRAGEEAGDLRDIFGWSLPFRAGTLPADLFEALTLADGIEPAGDLLKSRFRVASLGERLFVHSAYPTEAEDSVFFGPDTYRFARFVQAELAEVRTVRRLVEIGAGTGAAGIVAGASLPGARVTLSDINPKALALATANAAHAGIEAELVEGPALDSVEGGFDLILANPPYMMDEGQRTYRGGGDMQGAQVSLDWALAGARRLEPGGRMLLYTGVAMVGGRDALRAALEAALPGLDCTMRYEEIDPDVFGEELEEPAYRGVERIAAVGVVIERR